jgi:hypothetical protein
LRLRPKVEGFLYHYNGLCPGRLLPFCSFSVKLTGAASANFNHEPEDLVHEETRMGDA